MASQKSDLLQGTLELLILKTVALGPIHGYGIAQRIQQVSRDVLQVQQGSLYPALYRLEERGFLETSWRESDQGRMAKFYTLTAKGARQFAAERAQWERVAGAIALILGEAES
jgi:transcriptional regulator